MNSYEIGWTGSYPALCHGEWYMSINGEELDPKDIPFNNYDEEEDSFEPEPAYTERESLSWYFDENYIERFEPYKDGLDYIRWTMMWYDWLESIAPKEDWYDIYAGFQECDWRFWSCGGCI
jgi:hypothetical protein